MQVEMARVDAVATNVANAHTAHRPGESGYVPKRVVSAVVVRGSDFDSRFAAEVSAVSELMGVTEPERVVHEPSHPMADKEGNVAYPNVDVLQEMLALLDASRAYEADVQAFNMSKSMIQKALQIGGTR
jgi:flagellar basal-body rod protein FlgC